MKYADFNSTERELHDTVNEEHKYYPCVLLIDKSASMIQYGSLIISKLEILCQSLKELSYTQNEIEICTVLFNDTAEVTTPFTSVSNYSIPEIFFEGSTDYLQATNLAIQLIIKKLHEYKEKGIPYFTPLIIMLSDDVINENEAYKIISKAEQDGLFKFIYLRIMDNDTVRFLTSESNPD